MHTMKIVNLKYLIIVLLILSVSACSKKDTVKPVALVIPSSSISVDSASSNAIADNGDAI